MHGTIRFSSLPQIMRSNTFCEKTRILMHRFQQNYFSLVMSPKHIPKFTI